MVSAYEEVIKACDELIEELKPMDINKKREKIRKGIEQYTDYPAALWAYLHKNGLVLKVERELPEPDCCPEFAKCHEFCHTIEQCNMLKAGYVAVEPLIEK